MDTDTLVKGRVRESQKFLASLARNRFDVLASCWVKTSEEGQWFLYVVSSVVDIKGSVAAYRDSYEVLRAMSDASLSMSDIKLLSPQNPIARDILAILHRNKDNLPLRLERLQLGFMAVDEALFFPPSGWFPGFDEIKRNFPNAEIMSLTFSPEPRANIGSLVQTLSPLIGKINADEFARKPRGTLLFMGPKVSSGEATGALVFLFRPEGWNTMYRAETNSWEEVVHVGTGRKLYETIDFGPLMTMIARNSPEPTRKAKFVGGPYDGVELDYREINAVASILPVFTESGNRQFLLMPLVEEHTRILRGEITKDEVTGNRFPYERVFVGPGVVEYRDASAQGGLDSALSEASRPLSPEELAQKQRFAMRADEFIRRVNDAPLTPTTEVHLVYSCTDSQGHAKPAIRTNITPRTTVTFPGDPSRARELAVAAHRASIIGNINSLVRSAPTGFVSFAANPHESVQIRDIDLDIAQPGPDERSTS